MANREGIVLNGIDLNNLLGDYVAQEWSFPMPAKRYEWAQGADSDGAALVRDPLYENREIPGTLRVAQQASMDLALAKIGAIVDQLEEAERQDNGLPLVWTPANSTKSLTAYVLSGELDDVPISKLGDGRGWFRNYPLVKLKLYAKPFLYAQAIDTVSDAFATNTIANYSADSGAVGNVAVSGGVLDAAANFTTETRLVRNVDGYDGAGNYYDTQTTVKATVGATLASFKAGVVLKRTAANSYLAAYVDDNGTASRLRLDVVIAGVLTNRASINLAVRLTAAANLWVRARIEGNTVYLEHWTAAPTPTGTPTNSTSYTLAAGAEQTGFGQGVKGLCGLMLIPQDTAASLDDFTIEPNVWVGSNPLLTGTLPGVLGDVPAEAVLRVTERANQSRRLLEWGLQQRYADLATALQINSSSLATSGFAGTSTTRAGSVNTNVIRGTLAPSPSAVCGTGNLGHVGTFRIRARVYASSATVYVRLTWQDGSGAFRSNDYALASPAGGWSDVDLGTISISQAQLGTQQWTGRIEAYSTIAGNTVDIDLLELFPTDAYGKARGAYNYSPGALTSYDSFTGTTAGGVLNARTAPGGGAWATSGAATDFTFADAPGTEETASRATAATETGPRFAVHGTTNYTDSEASVRYQLSAAPGTFATLGTKTVGVHTRWVDASNYAYAQVRWDIAFDGTITSYLNLGTATTAIGGPLDLAIAKFAFAVSTWYTLRLVTYATGFMVATVFDAAGVKLAEARAISGAVATGGVLASGKPGFHDMSIGAIAVTRYYDDFYPATPAPEPIVLYAGRQGELRFDSAIRQDAAGTVYGPMPSYYGARVLVPPAGAAARTSRLACRGVRNNVEGGLAYDNPSGDNLQAQMALTPRFLLPR